MKKLEVIFLSAIAFLTLFSCQKQPQAKKLLLEQLAEDYIMRVYPKILEEPWPEGDTLCLHVTFRTPTSHYALDSLNVTGMVVDVWGALNWTFYSIGGFPPPPPPPIICPFDEEGKPLPPKQIQAMQDSLDKVLEEWDILYEKESENGENDLFSLSKECQGYVLFGPILVVICVRSDVPQEYVAPFLQGITLSDLSPRYRAGLLEFGIDNEDDWSSTLSYNDGKFMDGEFERDIIYQLDSLGHFEAIKSSHYCQ